MVTRTRKAKTTNAIELLKADHRTVEDLFARFDRARSDDQKIKIARQICLELSIHTAIEEEIFYPAVQDAVEDDLINKAYVEHDGAKMLLAEILATSPEDRFYKAKVLVLSDEIKQHVKEEEQRDGMFTQAKKAMLDMDKLGERLAARKEELKQLFSDQGVPIPTTRSMQGAELPHDRPAA